ncbi:MAG: EthD family reductase [Acidobacteria bacterium]|nr:MAG: EthD family reductase [Acidobacteriota bacterium]
MKSQEEHGMQRVTVLYPNAADTKFDFDYYLAKHVPWVAGLVGQKIEVRRGIASVSGSRAAFICVATIFIESAEQFKAVFAEHGAKILADIPNYTNSQPFVQIDEVLQG